MSNPEKYPIKLVVYGSNTALLSRFKESVSELPYLDAESGFGPEVTRKASLDAMWATPAAGAELFGASPPFAPHQARVFQSPAPTLARGLPRYGVVGVMTSPNDPKTPEFQLQLIVSALLRAIEDFNAGTSDKIRSVGILAQDLLLNKMEMPGAIDIIRRAFEDTPVRF